jgi:hypothetical protein
MLGAGGMKLGGGVLAGAAGEDVGDLIMDVGGFEFWLCLK